MAEPITQVLGIVGIKNRGEFNPETTYEKLNTVRYQGATYCAKTDTVGNLPTNGNYWDLMVEKGEKGDMPVRGVDYWTETDKAEIESDLASDVTSEVTEQLGNLTSAAPTAVSSISAMTDPNKIYVLSTNGHWYWNNGTDWIDGGVYQASVNTDDVNKLIAMQKNLDNLYNVFDEVRGSLNDSGGIGTQANTTLEVTSGYIPVNAEKKLTVLSYVKNYSELESKTGFIGYWFRVGQYDVNKDFISRNNSPTTTTIIVGDDKIVKSVFTLNQSTKYARISLRSYGIINNRVANDEINDYIPYLESQYDNDYYRDNYLDVSNINFDIEIGNILGTNGKNAESTTRARTKDYIKVGKGTVVYLKEKYLNRNKIPYFSIRYYSLDYKEYDTEIGDIGWKHENIVIPKDCYIRLVYTIDQGPGHPITSEDLDFFRESIIIKKKDISYSSSETDDKTISYHNKVLKAVNHRGYNTEAPENTLSAFRLSKIKGFDYVECDVKFTSDGVPVILHDNTINRTARNADGTTISETINIKDITFQQARQYDFGIYKSSDYAGEKIPSFEEFIILCKNLDLHPNIEIKTEVSFPTERAALLVNIVKKYNMLRNVTWVSFVKGQLARIYELDPKANIGFVSADLTMSAIDNIQALHNEDNEVFISIDNQDSITEALLNECIEKNIGIEIWIVDTVAELDSLPSTISSVVSNYLNAAEYNYKKYIEENHYLS